MKRLFRQDQYADGTKQESQLHLRLLFQKYISRILIPDIISNKANFGSVFSNSLLIHSSIYVTEQMVWVYLHLGAL